MLWRGLVGGRETAIRDAVANDDAPVELQQEGPAVVVLLPERQAVRMGDGVHVSHDARTTRDIKAQVEARNQHGWIALERDGCGGRCRDVASTHAG